MPSYNYTCVKCNYSDSGKLFSSFIDFQKHKCPQCGSQVKQNFRSMQFKINGYCYENDSKGDSMYRDIGKEKKRAYSHDG